MLRIHGKIVGGASRYVGLGSHLFRPAAYAKSFSRSSPWLMTSPFRRSSALYRPQTVSFSPSFSSESNNNDEEEKFYAEPEDRESIPVPRRPHWTVSKRSGWEVHDKRFPDDEPIQRKHNKKSKKKDIRKRLEAPWNVPPPTLGTWVPDELIKMRANLESNDSPTNVVNFSNAMQVEPLPVEDEDEGIGFEVSPNVPRERPRRLRNGAAWGKGIRKTSKAQAFLRLAKDPENWTVTVNGKPLIDYFSTNEVRALVLEPLFISETIGKFDLSCHVSGGGFSGQAQALRSAVADAIRHHDPLVQRPLKLANNLGNDTRIVERKKPGMKKARKKFQWSKR